MKPSQNDGDWINTDEKATDLIILSIQPDQFNYIKNANTSGEVWNSFKEVYDSNSPMTQNVFFKKLYRLKKSQSQTMTEFINEFVKLAQYLEECDMKLPENVLTIWLLNALPNE